MAHGPEGHDRLGDAREQGLRGRRDALALRASLRSDRRGVPSREPRPRARRVRRRKRQGSAGGAGHAPADPVRAALGSGALARPALRLDRGPVAPFRPDRPRPLSVLLGRAGDGALGRSRRDDRPLRGGRDRGRAVPPWRHPVHRHRAAPPAGRRARRREASRAGAGPRRDPRDRRVRPGEPRSRGGDRLMGALIQYFVDHPLAIPLFLLMFTAIIAVHEVAPNPPAAAAGIQPGDLGPSAAGRPATKPTDLAAYVTSAARADKEVTLALERNGRELPPITTAPRAEPPTGEGPLGIKLGEVTAQVSMPLPQAFGQALGLTGDVVEQIAALPGELIARPPGAQPPPVGGPIQIFVVTAAVSQLGFATFLKLVGVISVNLGVLNIIPFPGLDGGRLFFVLAGALLRRRLSPQVEAAIHAIGFVLLLGLLVVVSVADIRRATGG